MGPSDMVDKKEVRKGEGLDIFKEEDKNDEV